MENQRLREELREAIEAQNEAAATIAGLEQAIGRARGYLEDERKNLIEVRNRAAELKRAPVERIKNWARGTVDDVAIMAPDSESWRFDEIQAEERCEAARAAVDSLSSELSAAKTKHAATTALVRSTAIAVMTDEARTIAKEMISALEHAHRLQFRLLGIGRIWDTTLNRPITLPSEVFKALNWSEPQRVGGTDPVRDSILVWNAYLATLIENPDARMPEIPARLA